MNNEYINLEEYVEWLENLLAESKIKDLKFERVGNDYIDISFKPVKPVEYISFNLKPNNKNT